MTSIIAWFLIALSGTTLVYSPAFPTEQACKEFASNFNNTAATKMACLSAEILVPSALNQSVPKGK